jgi:exodeoxyribonuclease-3
MTRYSDLRSAMAFRLTKQGWTDALRALHPDERIYTFWKYFRSAFAGTRAYGSIIFC